MNKNKLLSQLVACLFASIYFYSCYAYYTNFSQLEKEIRNSFEFYSSFFKDGKINLKGSHFILSSLKDNIKSLAQFRVVIAGLSGFFVLIRASSSRLFVAYDILIFLISSPISLEYEYLISLGIKSLLFFGNFFIN